MKVKFIKSLIGTPPYKSGEEADLSQSLALRYIKSGICIPIKEEKVEQANVKPVTEMASKPIKRRRRTKKK